MGFSAVQGDARGFSKLGNCAQVKAATNCTAFHSIMVVWSWQREPMHRTGLACLIVVVVYVGHTSDLKVLALLCV